MIDPMTSRLAHAQHQEWLRAAAKARQHQATSVAAGRLIDRLRQAIGKQTVVLGQRVRGAWVPAKAYR